MTQVYYRDLGLIDYNLAWQLQEELFKNLIRYKTTGEYTGEIPQNYLLFCEHPHVYTLGKSGSIENLLINQAQLEEKHAQFLRINRGGDITYHGPGQVVGYPIFDLELFHLGIKKYVHQLEEVIIETLAHYGIQGERLEGATGVWLDAQSSKARKICAMGIRSSRYVTMHGFALNVNTDLSFFSYINPCGFTEKSVTSLSKELKREMDILDVKNVLKAKIASILDINFPPKHE